MKNNIGKQRIFSILIILIISFSILPTIMVSDGALSSSGIDLAVDGPKEAFVNQTESYKVDIIGSFSDKSINWSLKANIGDESIEKAQVTPPENESGTSNTFDLEFTAVREGKIELELTGYSSDGNTTRKASTTLEIKAVEPSTVNVEINNPTDINLKNIQVGVFVDDELKRVHDIDELGASEKKSLSINWSKEGLEEGKHTLQIWIDYNYKGGGSEFEKDEQVLEKDFYVEGEGFLAKYGWAVGIAVILGIVGLFYFMHMRRKRRRPW